MSSTEGSSWGGLMDCLPSYLDPCEGRGLIPVFAVSNVRLMAFSYYLQGYHCIQHKI